MTLAIRTRPAGRLTLAGRPASCAVDRSSLPVLSDLAGGLADGILADEGLGIRADIQKYIQRTSMRKMLLWIMKTTGDISARINARVI